VTGSETEFRVDGLVRRLPRRHDTPVASGRLTAIEAKRLQRAAGPAELDEALTALRVHYARAVLDRAVISGRLARREADRCLDHREAGEHSWDLRIQTAWLGRSGELGQDRVGDGTDPAGGSSR